MVDGGDVETSEDADAAVSVDGPCGGGGGGKAVEALFKTIVGCCSVSLLMDDSSKANASQSLVLE
jgi:hypothetical protein